MNEAEAKPPINISCPDHKFGHRFGGYTRAQLIDLLTNGGAIEGECPELGKPLMATREDRTSIAKALGVTNWR
jgi:hypothetical protein